MKRTNQTKYILIEFLAITFFATSGIFVRRSELPIVSLSFWRIAFALPILFLLGMKQLKNISKKDFLIILLSGVFYAGDIILYNYSIINTTMANSNLITNLTSFIIVPTTFFVFKEKIPKFYFAGLITAIIGVVILILGKASPTKSNYIGDICAGCACIFYATYILIIYKLREKYETAPIVFVNSLGIAIAIFIASLFLGKIQFPATKTDLINTIAFSLCLQVFGSSLFSYSQGVISANLSCAIVLCQPAIAGLFSLILFNEKLSIQEIIGMVVVAIGVYICKRQYDNK